MSEEEKKLWKEDLEIIFGNDFDEIQRNIKELDLSNKTIEWLNNLVDKDISITLEHITKRIEVELDTKDKIINLMAKWIFAKDYKENTLLIARADYYSNCVKQVEEYFRNKVKEGRNEI